MAVHEVVLAVVKPVQPVGIVPTNDGGVAVVKRTTQLECTHELIAPGLQVTIIWLVDGFPGTGVSTEDTAAAKAVVKGLLFELC